MLFAKAKQSKIWLESHCKFTWLEIPKKNHHSIPSYAEIKTWN